MNTKTVGRRKKHFDLKILKQSIVAAPYGRAKRSILNRPT